MTFPIDIDNTGKLFLQENLADDVSQIDLYNQERSGCTDFRINISICPIISNVLTNYKTEIIRFEGSDSAVSLTYNTIPNSKIDSVSSQYKGNDFVWNDLEAVRDTQLTQEGLEFTYHCGLDIFNNYHFRVEPFNFKSVCYIANKHYNGTFNTMFDLMREYDGNEVDGYDEYKRRSIGSLHLFTAEEVLNPQSSVDAYKIERNGWFGFENISKLRTYNENDECINVHSPIANRSANDFIDLTPSRDLFTFYPKWNDYRVRSEKNWNYCLTYPYKNTTDISFIRKNTNSLRIACYDELANDGLIYITSICKHGLSEGDFINLYNGDTILFANAKVVELGNGNAEEYNEKKEFCFAIKKTESISEKWVYKDVKPMIANENVKATYGMGEFVCYYDSPNIICSVADPEESYIVFNENYVNTDTLDLSYKKTQGTYECSYYVRINAKLPNFKYADEVIDDFSLQNNRTFSDKLISDYSTHQEDDVFENECGKLAFSKTIYQDDCAEVTYTENISIKDLLDNHNMPLHDIFFTIVKNNKGYKDWYYHNITNTENIEYSHIFGKISCAFELSKESELLTLNGKPIHPSIHTIHNIKDAEGNLPFSGLNISILNEGYTDDADEADEINFYKNRFFYNDLVCYSPFDCMESSIQQVQFRFNTAQRELQDNNELFSGITFDFIASDDYDSGKFKQGKIEYSNAEYNVFTQKEGYYYAPHYPISVRTVSTTKNRSSSNVVSLRRDTKIYDEDNGLVLLVTQGDNYAETDTKVVLYSVNYDTYFYGIISNIHNTYSCTAKLYKDYGCSEQILGQQLVNLVTRITNSPNNFRFAKPNIGNPTYAELVKDSSMDFQWRSIVPNGFDDGDSEVYPFANGVLYIDKNIIFYLRRQWWDRLDNINADKFPNETVGKSCKIETFDEYYDNKEIDCLI